MSVQSKIAATSNQSTVILLLLQCLVRTLDSITVSHQSLIIFEERKKEYINNIYIWCFYFSAIATQSWTMFPTPDCAPPLGPELAPATSTEIF